MLNRGRHDCNPPNAEPARNAKTQNRITQENGTHPLEARRAGTDGIQGVRLLLGIERSMGKQRNPFHGRGRAAKGRSCGFF